MAKQDPLRQLLEALENGASEEELQSLAYDLSDAINDLDPDAATVFAQEVGPEKAQAVASAIANAPRDLNVDFTSPQALEVLNNLATFVAGGLAPKASGKVVGGLANVGDDASQIVTKAGQILNPPTLGATQGLGRVGAGNLLKLGQAGPLKDPKLRAGLINWLKTHRGLAVGGTVLGTAGSMGIYSGLTEEGGVPAAGAAGDPTALAQVPGSAFRNPFPGSQAPVPAPEAVGQSNTIAVSPAARNVDRGYMVMLLDRDGKITGTPGTVYTIDPDDIGPAGISPEMYADVLETPTSGLGAGNVSDIISGTINQASIPGLKMDNRVIQTINPINMGTVQINAPIQGAPTGHVRQDGPLGTEADYLPGGALNPQAPPGGKFVQGTDSTGRVDTGRVSIPQGAELNARTFEQYQGKSLLEWANIIAKRNGVPLNILYGIISHESGWLKTAVGDNGNSFGLAQIYMPTWGAQVSKAQALDPVFAMQFTAAKLAQRYKAYGRWDAAIAAHNSPVAAAYLAKNNKFQNEKSASYVASVMSKSNVSGLDSTIFGEDDVSGLGIAGSGGSGATYTPFQEPDPAASRQYIRGVYQELLGRDPTEEELEVGVAKISGLAMSSYQANLTQAKGGKSKGVDIEAQFEEGIMDTGEFSFNEDTHDLDSFTDYAAGISRLLQQGL